MAAPHHDRNKTEKRIEYALIICVVALIAILTFLVVQYHGLGRTQGFAGRNFWSELLSHRAPLPATDANVIRPWMTFDYINHIFALPGTYLQAKLKITDQRYPKLTVAEYAEATHADILATLNEVEGAIRAYSETGTTSTAATTTR